LLAVGGRAEDFPPGQLKGKLSSQTGKKQICPRQKMAAELAAQRKFSIYY
jgi:hypothetical protein